MKKEDKIKKEEEIADLINYWESELVTTLIIIPIVTVIAITIILLIRHL